MYGEEATTDAPEQVATGAFKKDDGKAPIYQGFIQYFPRAIEAVANISKFGHDKYGTWGGWLGVEDGLNRYQDAKCRHMIDEAKGETNALDSQMLHAAHEAWGAMAKLELVLREEEEMKAWAQSPEAAEIVDQINNSYYLQPNAAN